MTDKDNITLPREVVQEALEALMVATTPIPADRHKVTGSIAALRTALAALDAALAEPDAKPEPVAYVDPKALQGITLGYYAFADICTDERQGRIPLYLAPPEPDATHPGYIIGSHWLETAYSRICAGEAEADVLRDCGWERVDDIEALRRDAERYRYLRDKAYVWDSDMPKAMRPVALWLHADGNANIDAAIDAAMEDKR